MKKFFSYILISTVMVANLLAPFSVRVGDNYLPKIGKNEARAEYFYSLDIKPTSGDTYFTIEAEIVEGTSVGENTIAGLSSISTSLQVVATVYDSENKEITDETGYFAVQVKKVTLNLDNETLGFGGLEPDTQYKIIVELKERIDTQTNQGIAGTYGSNDLKTLYTKELNLKTTKEDEAPVTEQQINISGTSTTINKTTEKTNLPECGLTNIGGCIAQILYYLLFSTTSFIFALAGRFFDIVFAYSISSASYETTFITQGWGIVRDLCNMFFIFVLLYIAFSTILETHGFNTKKTIINVIIIGLFINFSLFAVRIIVDASNILARVFYQSDAINIELKDGGNFSGLAYKPNEDGIIPMSAAIVNKIDPQSLVLESRKIGNYTTGAEQSDSSFNNVEEGVGVSTGTFILMILLSTAVNIYGAIIFLSVGLIFVTRVVGLWIAMIISPLAFFSYIVPSLSKQKMIGWQNWWPDTMKLAFLAPVFIFFMYIILQFLDKGLGMFDASKETGLTFILAVIIPFAFIFILLKKAKEIATDMSGEMGKSITGVVAAAGGLALGGAALGAAALGRGVIGKGMASFSKNEGAMDRAKAKMEFNSKLEKWEKDNKNGLAVGPKPTWEDHKRTNGIRDNRNPFTWIGSKVNEKQLKIDKINHARHEMDDAKKSAGLEGISDSNLSGADEAKIEKNFSKNKNSEVESNVRKGTDGKKDITLKENDGRAILDSQGREIKGEEAYKRAKREEVERAYIASENLRNPTGPGLNTTNLSDKDKKNIENELNKKFNTVLKTTTEQEIKHLFKEIREESKESINLRDKLVASSNKGSYDIRNISKVNDKSDKRDGFISKTGAFLVSSIAAGVRMGFKSSNINYGVGQKDFLTDLKNTLTDALKNIKVEVPKASGGGDHGGGGHGGGDHGGGGGHH